MEKKLYMMPLTEVEQIKTLNTVLLGVSPMDDDTIDPMILPDHPGMGATIPAPQHRTTVF